MLQIRSFLKLFLLFLLYFDENFFHKPIPRQIGSPHLIFCKAAPKIMSMTEGNIRIVAIQKLLSSSFDPGIKFPQFLFTQFLTINMLNNPRNPPNIHRLFQLEESCHWVEWALVLGDCLLAGESLAGGVGVGGLVLFFVRE